MFALAYELRQPVTIIEDMTHRQVVGWYEFLSERGRNAENGPPSTPQMAPEDGGIPYSMLSKADKKAMFHNSSGGATKKVRKSK